MRAGQNLEPGKTGVGCMQSLGKHSPRELCEKISVRISPGEGKDVLRLRAERNREKKHP